MSGLEVVVRPVVFPDIRPAPARVLPAEDDPDKGFAEITGSSGALIALSHSFSSSQSSSSSIKETKRQYDQEKVYQVRPDGSINRDNYIETERLKKVRLEGDGQDDAPVKMIFSDPPPRENVETTKANLTRRSNE